MNTISKEDIEHTDALIDVAGAIRGGAARLLRELDTAVDKGKIAPPRIIGRGRSLSPWWLASRNAYVRPGQRSIALNNATFLKGSPRVVLLRNVFHFATKNELELLDFSPPIDLRLQVPVIRALTRAADIIVCPCSAMAERVATVIPSVSDRIEVRFHPVSPIDKQHEHGIELPDSSPYVLVPIVNSPYKRLEGHLNALLDALDHLSSPHKVVVTGTPTEYTAQVANHPRMQFLGIIPSAQLDQYWKNASLVYFPLTMEAFGYPLAEARVNGIPILSPDTSQAREIAGQSLVPLDVRTLSSFAESIANSTDAPRTPDPGPFSPRPYFDWLINAGK